MESEEFQSVLAAAQAGGEWAWSRLYREFAGPVLGYLRARGAAEPEDVLGEVLLQVARGLESFSGDVAGFRSWLFTITHRRLIDERRARGRRPVEPVADLEPRSAEEDPAAVVADRLASEEIVAMFDRLSAEQRDVLLLRLVGGLTVDEVAAIVGKSRGAVKALQRRGLSTVKRNLTQRVPL